MAWVRILTYLFEKGLSQTWTTGLYSGPGSACYEKRPKPVSPSLKLLVPSTLNYWEDLKEMVHMEVAKARACQSTSLTHSHFLPLNLA